MSANNNKRIQSIDWLETYAYGMNQEITCKREKIKCINIIKLHEKKMTYDDVTKDYVNEHNLN